jgi:uncharacterized membrane protein
MSGYLNTTIAVYSDVPSAEADWAALEAAAEAGRIQIADGAFVENKGGEAVILHRRSQHGWGKGAIAGAVVGVLFPLSIIGAAAVGAGGGALTSRLSRSLGRNHVKDLGQTLESGAIAILLVFPIDSTLLVSQTLTRSAKVTTVPGATVEEIQEAMKADSSTPSSGENPSA